MEIEFNPYLTTANNSVSPSTVRPVSTPPDGTTMPFENTQALEQTLKETPTVRPDVVARATASLADPSWPSDELLSRVAGSLAASINKPQAGGFAT